ncbi:MAG TPA: DUF4232 domain-containing protein [Acidimicrobiales bacterium]|nr:DUF4232 domain-containing protein [Acidimicrobiales bacterium]
MSRALKSLGLFFAFVVIYTLSRHAIHSTTPTTTSSTIPSVSTTSSVPSGTPECSARDFRGVLNPVQGAMGTVYTSVTLTKDAGPTCTLRGWPALTLQDRTGAILPSTTNDLPTTNSPITFPDVPANRAPTTLTLKNGATATFDLAYSNVPNGAESCPSVVTLSVQFVKNGSVVVVTPAYPPQPCNQGNIWVSPFF